MFLQSKMNLVVDVGNTSTKAAIFKCDKILKVFIFDEKNILSELKKIISENKISKAIISSVVTISKDKRQKLERLFSFMVLSSATKVPFINLYQTPQTLGVDRIALISGTSKKYPNKDMLIIDAGTCITFDFINSKKEYLGGAISPGIAMRYKALQTFTSKLPLLEATYPSDFIGDNTADSIHSGIINGIFNEITGVINQYKEKYPNLDVILTGGDTYFLKKRLKSSIFANSNFVLEGLHTILTYNKNE